MLQCNKGTLFGLISLAAGVISFFIFSDPAILNPSNISWLMSGDPAQHYLGWSTFRHTPFMQWPVGLNYNYGMEISNSIVFTDSIPLIAIPLKYVEFLLPQEFQYTGIWLFLCYLLQSLFGYKVFRELTGNRYFSLVGGFILSFAPTFLLRMQGHYALCGQFLILISFLLYLKPFSRLQWMLLICVTALVHAYLLMMVLSVFVAKVLVDVINTKHFTYYAKSLILSMAACAFVMYAEGYFVISNGLAAGGFGEFRADLLALFNPYSPAFSKFSRVNNNQLMNGEGLAYLGFGVIMCLGSLVMMVFNKISNKEFSVYSSVVYVPCLTLLGLYVFAVSNVISLQGYEIYRINLPDFLVGPVNTFRASGRFMWPISYFIMAAALFSIHYLSKKSCVTIIVLIALVQLFDTYKFGDLVRANIRTTEKTWNKNKIEGYSVDYSKFKSIAMYPPRDFQDKSKVIYLGALHGLPVNAGYMARYDVVKESMQNRDIDNAIAARDLKNNVIYFIGDSAKSLTDMCVKGFVCEEGFAGRMMFSNRR